MLVVDKPTSAEGKNMLEQLRKLCPDADLQLDQDGKVAPKDPSFCETAGDARKCKHPRGCSCICQLITSENTWTIKGVKIDDVEAVFPHTLPDDTTHQGSNGHPTGGVVTAPTEDSGMEFDAYDPEGQDVTVPFHKVLGHELCGHAKHMDKGDHPPGPETRGDRPGHDQAIEEENNLRVEERMTMMRGFYNNPNRGESTAHPRKTR